MKNTIKVSVRLETTEDPRVEEGTIDVRGEDGRWASTGGWHRPIIRVRGRLYLHGRVAEAIRGGGGGGVSSEPGALRWGRGRASATYVPIDEAEVLRLADVDNHHTRYGKVPQRELDRNAAIAAFAYALVDLLPATSPEPAEPRRIPVAALLPR
jgi:hypothetical protein